MVSSSRPHDALPTDLPHLSLLTSVLHSRDAGYLLGLTLICLSLFWKGLLCPFFPKVPHNPF